MFNHKLTDSIQFWFIYMKIDMFGKKYWESGIWIEFSWYFTLIFLKLCTVWCQRLARPSLIQNSSDRIGVIISNMTIGYTSQITIHTDSGMRHSTDLQQIYIFGIVGICHDKQARFDSQML